MINNSRIKTQGRTYNLGDSLGIDFSGAGIEFNAYCEGDVSITVNAGKAGLQFMAIVDGVESDILLTTAAGENVFTIGSDLVEGNHTFAFYRISSYSSSSTIASIVSVELTGGLTAAPAEKDLRVEVIGDSITCGAGGVITVTDGTNTITDYNGETIKRVMIAFTPKAGGNTVRYEVDYLSVSGTTYNINISANEKFSYSAYDYDCIHEFYGANGELLISVPYGEGVTYDENAYYAYSVQTPIALGADWTVFSQSGANIQEMYERYLTMYGRNSASAYAPDKQADIVVINLATNGLSTIEDYEGWMDKFVEMLREYHPDCKIVFAYGAMTNYQFANIHNRIDAEVADLGGADNGIYSFQFTLSRDGSGGHPSMANHLDMAAELTAFINANILN